MLATPTVDLARHGANEETEIDALQAMRSICALMESSIHVETRNENAERTIRRIVQLSPKVINMFACVSMDVCVDENQHQFLMHRVMAADCT